MGNASLPEAIWFAHYLARILVDGDASDGAFALCEMEAETFLGPWHVHSRETETFYVLEGRLRVDIPGASAEIGPGEVFSTPLGTPHRYSVVTDRGRWLMLSTPSGFENLIRETGIPAKALVLPPSGQVPDAAANEGASERFGITYLPMDA
jgi:mannose-6-phosphate isomerase-like protein (cupin superfamily)